MITVEPGRLGVREGDLVLDAGCGEGRHTWELVKKFGCRVFALDLDLQGLLKNLYVLRSMEGKGEKKGSYFILRGDVLALPFPDATFDRIICAEVLEHVADEFQAVAELVRVLKPGGTLGVSVPTWITESIYWRLDKSYSHPGGHIRIFRARELRALLEAFGLRVYGSERRHSLHSLYWFLRCLFRLEREDAFLPRIYFRWLCWVEKKPSSFFKGFERLLDPVLGKSLVLYARKEKAQAVAAGDARARLKRRRNAGGSVQRNLGS